MTFSVVIATHIEDRWDRLVEAVDSALSQSPPPHEVIVVVDHNPSLLGRIRAELGVRVTALPNSGERGPSGSRNTGAAAATGTLVAYLDDDARAQPGWLVMMQEAFADAAVIGVGGLASPDWETGSAPTWLPEEFFWVVGCHYRGHRTTPGPVRAPIGANMAFRREEMLESGGFSWQVSKPPFARCEETELAMRLAAENRGIIQFVPDAVVLHSVPSSRAKWSYFARRCRLEGQAKADLAVHAGLVAATSVERSYVVTTLGRGFLRHLGSGLTGRISGFARAANLAVGLGLTTYGFLEARLARTRPHHTDVRTVDHSHAASAAVTTRKRTS